MDNLVEEHICSIDTLITFLDDYRTIVKKNSQKFQNKNLSGNFYVANIKIENLQDRLLEILSTKKDHSSEHISQEIDEYNSIQKDIKEMMPIMLYYYMCKKTINFDQMDP